MLQKAACIQFDIQKGQIQANMDLIYKYLDALAQDRVQLAVLPEMFSCSFDNEQLAVHAGQTEKIVASLCRFAGQNNMAIAGSLPRQGKAGILNEMIFIDTTGELLAGYHKLHLFGLTGEDDFYAQGNEIVCIDTSLGRIGLMTCYDLRFPELARSLFLKEAQIVIVSAQWPSPRKEQWKILAQARAVENQLFMVCTNRTGVEDNLQFPGMSLIVDPMGRILAQGGDSGGTAVAEIELKRVAQFRKLIPCKNDRRPDIYG